jgi:hypothetical protein
MDTITVAQNIAESVEQELARVRAARPSLASRISRAENILVTHHSSRRQRVLRVRTYGGRARFLVSGSGGAVYVVDPASWSCLCPDHHRRGAACEHSIACWALWRVLQAARPASLAPSSRACSFMLPKATGPPAQCPRRTEPSRRGEK